MPEPGEITELLELEREQERRVAASLSAAEREVEGTPEEPSLRATFAHAIGAKWHMHNALIAHRDGAEPEPDPAHDREAIFRANAGRPFEALEDDAARVADALLADVRALDPGTLASSPPGSTRTRSPTRSSSSARRTGWCSCSRSCATAAKPTTRAAPRWTTPWLRWSMRCC